LDKKGGERRRVFQNSSVFGGRGLKQNFLSSAGGASVLCKGISKKRRLVVLEGKRLLSPPLSDVFGALPARVPNISSTVPGEEGGLSWMAPEVRQARKKRG